jgi:predicted flap endonuclease-1-like 5' DNA nuclease
MRLTSVLASAFLLTVTLVIMLVSGAARASYYAVADVPRIIPAADVDKLHKAGIETTEQLLDKGAKTKDRKALAKAADLKPAALLDLVRRCDLLRIKGVGSEMVLLLEAAGVKTTAELAKRQAGPLTEGMLKVNQTKKITEKPPTEPQLRDWIGQAQKLPQVLELK